MTKEEKIKEAIIYFAKQGGKAQKKKVTKEQLSEWGKKGNEVKKQKKKQPTPPQASS